MVQVLYAKGRSLAAIDFQLKSLEFDRYMYIQYITAQLVSTYFTISGFFQLNIESWPISFDLPVAGITARNLESGEDRDQQL